MSRKDEYPELQRSLERRHFLKAAAAGTLVIALGGGTYVLADENDPRAKQLRPDGRVRLPPGQRLLTASSPWGATRATRTRRPSTSRCTARWTRRSTSTSPPSARCPPSSRPATSTA